ncbi:hypothetical protein OF83DRAFT_1085431 [Amylostereum chailletii]|nr:hypothetical protein OF83DRAFT_1085431 [Amylostereum chailletii]
MPSSTRFFGSLTAILFFFLRVFAQDLSVPQDWNSTALSYNELVALTSSAADILANISIPGTSAFDDNLTADMVAVLATNDLYHKNKAHQTAVENLVQTFPLESHPLYFDNVAIFWGLACYYAYRAYADVFFLNTAIQIWNQTFPYWISEAEATAGTTPARNVSIAPGPQCTPVSASTVAAGAVLTNFGNTTTDTSADAPAVGAFMVLSAYLYEERKDSKYLNAATLSATFINNTLYQSGVVVNGYNLVTCVADKSLIESHYSGFFVEGLAVIANVTGDETWFELLNTVVASTVKTTQWTRADGVITEGIFIRGLHEARVRSDRNSAMALLIDSYTNVQINAILAVANKDRPLYSSNWAVVKTSATATYGGTIAALDVFNSALDAVDPLTITTTSASGPTETVSTTVSPTISSSNHHSSPPVGAIAGGAVGGVVGAMIICLLVLFCVRHQHRRRGIPEPMGRTRESDEAPINPFTDTTAFRADPPATAWRSLSKATLLQRDAERRQREVLEPSAAVFPAPGSGSVNMRSTITNMTSVGDSEQPEQTSTLLRELVVLLRQRSEQPPEYNPSPRSAISSNYFTHPEA